ncbi:YcgN family cysteine cluster protein [Gilliamella sp. CG35]|uniref:YcgN family cysteine cluster protein n=1 Tax=Gilliamella sp. CG35 TaxID=3351507 RepID=UPI00398695AC
MIEPFWKGKTLDQLSDDEWEQLCDGCGQCCLNKLMDEDTDEILYTNVACNLLDANTCQCKHYVNRFKYEPDCIKLTRENLLTIEWLPLSCTYRYFQKNGDLPEWHPLIVGNKKLMHELKISVKNRIVYEKDVICWEDHII